MECEGENTKRQDCDTDECLADCLWGEWSKWSPCSASCDGGLQISSRRVKRPSTGQGRECSGKNVQTQDCATFSCSSKSAQG